MTIKAYSYIRFSRPEQMKGNSLIRQAEKSLAYCTANQLVLDTELNLKDLGISAFKGKNLDENAALGGFLKAIDEGRVSVGSYLLIESLDRLSRQQISDAYDIFKSIIKKGITIVTLSDSTVYDEESLNDFGKIIISLAVMSRAHEESKIKSDRLLAANRNKRKNISTKKLSSQCPAWLSYDKKKDSFVPIPDKVKTVNRIFQLSASGMGTYAITSELTKKNIKPIGKSGKWYQSYLTKILKGREVLGDFTSNSPDGKQIFENYYPRIIELDLYYRTQESIKSRQKSFGGRKGKYITNLFSKLAICGYSIPEVNGNACTGHNEAMTHVNKGKHSYLQCRAAKAGNYCCKQFSKPWRYDDFEKILLTYILEIDASILFKNNNSAGHIKTLNGNVRTLSGELQDVERKIKLINNTMLELTNEDVIPKSFIEKLNKLEEKEAIISIQLKNNKEEIELTKAKHDTPIKHTKRLKSLIELLPTLQGDELYALRLKLSELLKLSIDKIEVFSTGVIDKNSIAAKVSMTKSNEKKRIVVIKFKSGTIRHIQENIGNKNHPYTSLTEKELIALLDMPRHSIGGYYET